MVHLKRSIVEVKAKENCLAHALIISIPKLTNDSDYIAFRKGCKIRRVVDHLLATTGIVLSNGGGIAELIVSRVFQRVENCCFQRFKR